MSDFAKGIVVGMAIGYLTSAGVILWRKRGSKADITIVTETEPKQ